MDLRNFECSQVTLPETLEVGQKSFFATGNILTSVDVDRGQFKVPCITYMGTWAQIISDPSMASSFGQLVTAMVATIKRVPLGVGTQSG